MAENWFQMYSLSSGIALLLTCYKNGAFISISQNIVSQYSELIHSWKGILNIITRITDQCHCETARVSVVVKDLIFYHGRSWGRRGRLWEKKANIELLSQVVYIIIGIYKLTIHVIIISWCLTEEFKPSTASGTGQQIKWRKQY